MSAAPCSSRLSPVTTVTATGTSCTFSSRLRAVTVMTSLTSGLSIASSAASSSIAAASSVGVLRQQRRGGQDEDRGEGQTEGSSPARVLTRADCIAGLNHDSSSSARPGIGPAWLLACSWARPGEAGRIAKGG